MRPACTEVIIYAGLHTQVTVGWSGEVSPSAFSMIAPRRAEQHSPPDIPPASRRPGVLGRDSSYGRCRYHPATERVANGYAGESNRECQKIMTQGGLVTPYIEFNPLTTCTRDWNRRNQADEREGEI